MKQPRNILVFRTCGLGDFVLSAPAFRALRQRFPASRITLLAMKSTNAQVAAHILSYSGGQEKSPWVDLLAPHLIDDVVSLGPLSLGTLATVRKELAPLNVDLVVQMIDVNTPWPRRFKKILLLALLTGIVRQIGWRVPGIVTSRNVPAVDPQVPHHVHGPMHFLKELYGPGAYHDSDIVFDVRPGNSAEAHVQEWLAAHNLVGRRLVAIAPGAAHPHKAWPLEKFVALVESLLEHDHSLAIAISGTKAERAKAEAMIASDPTRVFDATNGFSIPQSAALYSYCSLVVGNDGGAMHLADAMGARVVSIVPGLEFPNSIEPWNNRHRAIRHSVACAPCYSFTCCPKGHNRCMIDLPFEAVLAQSKQALAEAG